MANLKTGFNYYSTDTDRYQDIKIKRLKHRHGGEGLAVYDYLLCEIYREKGCYMEWNEYVLFHVAEYMGMQEEEVDIILETILSIGLFDKGMFEEKQLLTSRSIQIRFVEMSTRAKRKIRTVPAHINLIEKDKKKRAPKVPEKPLKVPEESTKVPEVSKKTSKRKKKKSASAPAKVTAFSVEKDVDEGFKTSMQKWLSYKRSRGQTYRSPQSIEALYKQLLKLSGEDPEVALKIVEQSMANNWAGLYELKESKSTKKNEDARKRKLRLMQEAAELHSKEKRNGS